MKRQRQTLQSKYGPIRLLKDNPRKISPGAFSKLLESLERDPDFMRVKRIVVDENGVVIGGNQRFKALRELGYESIPDEWIARAAHEDGSPLTEEEKRRFVFIDNNPEGISGEFDYAAMVEGTSLDLLRDVGIDLSKIELPEEARAEFEGEAVAEIENESPAGEESEKLKDLHRKRAESKEKFEDMQDYGFYAVLVFMSNEQRKAFGKWCAEHGVRTKYEGLYANGEDMAGACGIKLPPDKGKAIRERLPSAVLEGMTLDGAGASGDAGDEDEE